MASLPTLQSRRLLQTEDQNKNGEHDFSVVTYNILADFYLQSALSMGRYKNCPQEFVTPKQDRNCPRHKLLMTEVRHWWRPKKSNAGLPLHATFSNSLLCLFILLFGGTPGCGEVLLELHTVILASKKDKTCIWIKWPVRPVFCQVSAVWRTKEYFY